MARLKLFFLGTPRIELDGAAIQFDTRKATALLAYLAVTGQTHSRDALADLLWPKVDHRHGRAALRRTLSTINSRLKASFLAVDRSTIALNPGVGIWLDVNAFHDRLADLKAHPHGPKEVCRECGDLLRKAVDLYRSDFLANFALKDSISFDDWQFFQAEDLRLELAAALEKLIRCSSLDGDFETAISLARRRLDLDPLHESAHRSLMQLYDWAGMRSAAFRQYQECTRILKKELGISPHPDTTNLCQAIRANRAPPPAGAKERDPDAAIAAPMGPASRLIDEEYRIVTVMAAAAHNLRAPDGKTIWSDEISLQSLFYRTASDVIARYGGITDRYFGSSILAVFGNRKVSESDPEIAIRAALDIQSETAKSGISVSAGISTGGIYVTRRAGRREFESIASGSVANSSLKLLMKAADDQILVGYATYRLTRKAFRFSPAPGSGQRAGNKAPAYRAAYRVQSLLPLPKKARGIEGTYASMVGRTEELRILEEAAKKALSGHGQIVTIFGNAGVGKTRLVDELKSHLLDAQKDNRRPWLWLEGRCLEMGKTIVYWPFIDLLRKYFSWMADDDDNDKARKIIGSLEELTRERNLSETDSAAVTPFIAYLLSLRSPGLRDESIEQMDSDQLKRNIFISIRDLFLGMAKNSPVALVLEDLHWCDSVSLDLVSFLMETLESSPILLICIYRPEQNHRCWHLHTVASSKCPESSSSIMLNDLSLEQSCRLVEALLSVREIPQAVKDLIIERAQGNPFYVEEIVRSLLESGNIVKSKGEIQIHGSMSKIQLPETVQSVILSRIDRLSEEEKEILEIAAVIGDLFPKSLLDLMPVAESKIEKILDELEDRELIYKQSVIPEELYSFKHVLTQEAAYRHISPQNRRSIHALIAKTIEERCKDNPEDFFESLAYHFERGGLIQKAVEYLCKASEKAKRSSAHEDAIAHLEKGLTLLETIDEPQERNGKELVFLLALGMPMVLTEGHSAPEVRALYEKAEGLCRLAGSTSQLFDSVIGLRRYYFATGELKKARELADRALTIALESGDSGLETRAYMMASEVLLWQGELHTTVEYASRGANLYDPHKHQMHIFVYGNDSLTGCRLFCGLAQWFLGYPDTALAAVLENLERAREISHPFNLVFALYFAAFVYTLRGEYLKAKILAEEVLHLAGDYRFSMYEMFAQVTLGWILVESGSIEKGREIISRYISESFKKALVPLVPVFATALSKSYRISGDRNIALRILLDIEKRIQEDSGGHIWIPEILTSKGLLSLEAGKETEETWGYFRSAVKTAHAQGARSLELRAAASWFEASMGTSEETAALSALKRIHESFEEGRNTVDLLRSAKLLSQNPGKRKPTAL